jgi:3-isopropylmalate dehydratase small subunit
MVLKFHEAPHTAAQLYGVPHVILRVFNTIFYENEFQNPQIFQQTISFFPEQTLDRKWWPSGPPCSIFM